jgi:hypothetical protein
VAMLRAPQDWLRAYWVWTNGGSRWRLVAGLGGPLLAAILVASALGGSSEPEAMDTPPKATSFAAGVTSATPVPPSPGASTPTLPPATSATSVSAQATVAAPISNAATYVVVAGDNPSLIAQKLGIPAEQREAWTQQVLALNGVSAAGLQVGQILRLPQGGSVLPSGASIPQQAVNQPTAARPAPTQPPVQVVATAAAPPTTVAPNQSCHPSYQGGLDAARGGCIRAGLGDYDCEGGGGNGPNYARGPLTVVGLDEFMLDTNDPDNIACEPPR